MILKKIRSIGFFILIEKILNYYHFFDIFLIESSEYLILIYETCIILIHTSDGGYQMAKIAKKKLLAR